MSNYKKSMSVFSEIESDVVDLQVSMGVEILNRCVLGTRVDTGRARGNWQASTNSNIDSSIEAFDRVGSETISAGVSEISSLNSFGATSIQNNLPYIDKLNDLDGKYVERAIYDVLERAAKI